MIKWIGQHIWDFVSRFRNDVYLESVADGTVHEDKFLGLDSTGKIVKEAVVSSSGDITGVDLTGGTGIEIASETNTTSGDYSATINCDLEGTELKSTTNGNEAVTKFLRADGDGTCSWQVPSYTTYSVGDGGLTTNDFTNADHTKLNGIEAGAEVNVNADWNSSSGDSEILNKPTIPSGNQIIDWTVSQGATDIHADNYTNTTYSEATSSDAGLMSTAHHDKLDGIEAGATADQTQADINGLAITTVGALNSGSITSGFGNIDTGSSTIDTTGAVTTGILQPAAIKHVISGNSAGDYGSGAEILYNIGTNGGASFTTGAIYVMRAGQWNPIDCSASTTSTNICAVALGADTSSGMLIKGCVTLAETYEAGSDSAGKRVYGSATDSGRATLTAPTSSGHFVRILGYSLNVGDKKMFFNPDNTYVEIA